MRLRVLNTLEGHRLPLNTQTYDDIYFRVRMREVAGRSLTSHNHVFRCGAPPLDPAVARYGYSLPRRRRFFNRLHRSLLSEVNQRLARIPTTEGGVTAPAETRALVADATKYVADKGRRLVKKVGQRTAKVTVLQPSPNHPDLANQLRRMCHRRGALQEAQIMSPELEVEDVPAPIVGRVLVVGSFVAELYSEPGIPGSVPTVDQD